jgi:hypothetical protein
VVALISLGGVTTGCAAATSAEVTGRVEGVVVAGPTCPVERAEQPCPPRPVSGEVRLVRDGDVAAQVQTDSAGHYVLSAPAGHYLVVVDVGGPFPRCPVTPVDVGVVATVTANVDCDTGIR